MTTRRAVAAYQIACGAVGLLFGARSFAAWFSSGQTQMRFIASILLAGCVVALLAGVLLWKGHTAGHRLSVILQALSLPVITTPWISYLFFIGLEVHVGIQHWLVPLAGLPPDARGTEVAFGFNYIAGISYSFLKDTPSIGVFINLSALVALLALLHLRRSTQVPLQAPAPQVAV